jgi:hypothetical protein
MSPSPVASLLVAALVVLRLPCARNQATARLLLARAAEHDSLTAAEREACRQLADDLDIERPDLEPVLARASMNTPRRTMPVQSLERRTKQVSTPPSIHAKGGSI